MDFCSNSPWKKGESRFDAGLLCFMREIPIFSQKVSVIISQQAPLVCGEIETLNDKYTPPYFHTPKKIITVKITPSRLLSID